MSGIHKIYLMVIVIIYFMLILVLMKRKKLYLKYALLWIITDFVMGLLILWPQSIAWLFRLCGFQLYSNGLFAILIFFILLILLALTSIVSRLNEKNRKLAQAIALLEKRVRDMEEKLQ